MSAFSCITSTIIWLTILFIVIGIPILAYYSRDPKDPTFTLEHASMQGFNLTSDGHLTSFFNIIIKANNPSRKMWLDYSRVRVAIFKDNQNLAEDALDDFTQGKRNVTVLRAEPIALKVSLDKEPLFNLRLERGMGYIIFDVFMSSLLNNATNLVVNCENVVLNVTSRDNNLIASSPSIIEGNDAKKKFPSIDCGVDIYTNDNW